jgi:hypothetical protein
MSSSQGIPFEIFCPIPTFSGRAVIARSSSSTRRLHLSIRAIINPTF